MVWKCVIAIDLVCSSCQQFHNNGGLRGRSFYVTEPQLAACHLAAWLIRSSSLGRFMTLPPTGREFCSLKTCAILRQCLVAYRCLWFHSNCTDKSAGLKLILRDCRRMSSLVSYLNKWPLNVHLKGPLANIM